ncbi:MAG: hypothetical protein IH948_00320 [Bacteroidetes bacterium]|nr:hypothetical protein [Bacteroidota bacterium]
MNIRNKVLKMMHQAEMDNRTLTTITLTEGEFEELEKDGSFFSKKDGFNDTFGGVKIKWKNVRYVTAQE